MFSLYILYTFKVIYRAHKFSLIDGSLLHRELPLSEKSLMKYYNHYYFLTNNFNKILFFISTLSQLLFILYHL
jgi:hypothetical protein